MKYNIITPVKNEANYILNTIKSVINQEYLPEEWIIVDDKSTDETVNIINEYIIQFPFIKIIPAPKTEIIEVSARIAYLFNFGFSQITNPDEVIMKLDADVILPKNYCKDLLSIFEFNPKLGIVSGCVEYKGKNEKNLDSTLTRGAAKFYRLICFEQIGFAYLSRGWDTMDNYAAQFHGWDTKKVNIYFKHAKKEGQKSGIIMLRYWTGLYNGRVPYYFPYFVLKVIYHLFKQPIILGSLLETIGYFNARFVQKIKPFPDEICKYVRNVQKKKISTRLKKIL